MPIILLLAVVMTLFLLPTEEEKIEFLFYELSEVASKTEDASTLSDAMVVKDFRELFAPKVLISIRSKARIAGEHSNQGLAQLYGRLRVASRRMELRCEQIEKISISESVAVYSVKFFAGWTGKGGNVVNEDAHSRVELRKIDGDWKFSQIDYLKK
tara:strand:+ start:460 stop:927 length:468 start_codon:yes stop_codon:yes gene_type:complete